MAIVEMKELLEAGVHFGHRVKRWHPKMRSYIFTERNGIHIIDIQQTIRRLEAATDLIKEDISDGGMILFVGTKKQAQEHVAEAAERCGMPYVNQRWLGGTLTNYRTIRQRIDYLIGLEQSFERGEFEKLTKKEILGLERKMSKLNRRLGGIKNMDRLPSMVFITDVRREHIAVKEANKLDIPIIAMVDTNCDPTPIDHVIPANDDAIRSIKLISSKLADAVVEGQQIRDALLAEEEEEVLEPPEELAERLPEEELPVLVEEFAAPEETPVELAEEQVGQGEIDTVEVSQDDEVVDLDVESAGTEETAEGE
ncbi:MAG: 30S ribosomal protein S2 [Anaerolineae bacterium]|nr:30S ribosomal protein S2 [Anaerolineae bacterium]NIN99421.1 30S ribosomal protein S2 [Anaerolineae bacterium]NIQ82286.1 30S ribosomal protein S2 [Anaerolineae bacterium]